MVYGVILAGGAGRRIGGDKAFAVLGGQPLIGWAINALQPQVSALSISGEGAALNRLGLRLLADPADFSGPGAGLLAALSWAQGEGATGLLVAPCDMPFLPPTLVEDLRSDDSVCVPMIEDRALWAISYWPPTCIKSAAAMPASPQQGTKGASLRSLIQAQPCKTVPMKPAENFFGINTPDALAQAQRMAALSQ